MFLQFVQLQFLPEISNTPLNAYKYVVNGKSAIEWVMKRYKGTAHRESGIKKDPDDWVREDSDPGHILGLILSAIWGNMERVRIVAGLLRVEWE